MRLQQSAANHLRRMRREHELDPQRLHCVGERAGRQTVVTPARECVGTRTRLRRAAPVRARTRAAGGPGDAARRYWPGRGTARTPARSARPAPIGKSLSRSASCSKAFGSLACARFASARTSSTSANSRVAFKVAERLAEQSAEQPHIVAQCLMRILGHGSVPKGGSRQRPFSMTACGCGVKRSYGHSRGPQDCDSTHIARVRTRTSPRVARHVDRAPS